jgi:hypothetical protein
MTSSYFQKIKYALKGQKFQGIKYTQKSDDSTVSYYTTEIPKMFPTVAAWLG